jgi:ABC-type uncharacterized transport system substrate-binding protein
VSLYASELNEKRLEVFKEAFPNVKRVGALRNGDNFAGAGYWDDLRLAAEHLGVDIRPVVAKGVSDLAPRFADTFAQGLDGLVVITDAEFDAGREQIVRLAAEYHLPTMYEHRAFSIAHRATDRFRTSRQSQDGQSPWPHDTAHAPRPRGRGHRMRRREVLIGVMATAMSPSVRAQTATRKRIAFLSSGSAEGWAPLLPAFKMGLREAGYVEGDNFVLEYSWAGGNYDRLPDLAAEVAQKKVDLIVAAGGGLAGRAAKNATSTIPIVLIVGDDPVRFGLVRDLARPGENVTGVTLFIDVLTPKRLEVASELIPNAALVLLANPQNPNAASEAARAQEAAQRRGRELRILQASTLAEVEAAVAGLSTQRGTVLMIGTDPFFFALNNILPRLASRHGVPTVYFQRQFALVGGLISYGATLTEEHRLAGVYAGRILSGEKAGDLPILQPSRFELVINLNTAKALGITIPPTLLARADEVIE